MLRKRYNNLKLILFGDLNINIDEIDIKLKNKIEPYGLKLGIIKIIIQEVKQ